jgi:chromosome segregation ATPase
MGEAIVDQNQLEQIGTYVKNHIGEWIREQKIYSFPSQERTLDKELLERMVAVEQQLKFQNEKFELMMNLSDRRFDAVDKRFEQVDKRFEQVDKRFEQVDKRFEQIDKRFDAVDKRFNRLYVFLTGIFLTLLGGFIPLLIKAI